MSNRLNRQNRQNRALGSDSVKYLTFDQLERGKFYRALHGGERDHGYNYTLNEGKLWNATKGKKSSLEYDKSLKFVATLDKFKRYDSLNFPVELTTKGVVVGCQTVDVDDALMLALDILNHFQDEKIVEAVEAIKEQKSQTFVVDDIPF